MSSHLAEERPHEVVIVSRDDGFVTRLKTFSQKCPAVRPVVTVFNEPLSALIHLLTHTPHVVVYDMDCDTLTRNLETLRGIRLIRGDVPIILGAQEHSTPPFDPENDVGVFYRLLKSASDGELEVVLASARRPARR